MIQLPDWLEDLERYQIEQARALALGIWPRETALRERAISSTITIAVVNLFLDEFARKRREGELDAFPPFPSATLSEISNHIESAILAGGWLQSQRALEYLDDHPSERT